MSYENGVISAPVSIADVKQALYTNSNDLATLCRASNIDKWAAHKPVVYAKLFTNEGGKGDGNYGLTPIIVEGNSDYTEDTTAMKKVIDLCVTGEDDWTYTKPSGGTSSPYRLSDFEKYKPKNHPPFYMDYTTAPDINTKTDAIYYWKVTFADSNSDYSINYNNIKALNDSTWYMWMFYSTSKDFATFRYVRADNPFEDSSSARLGTQITTEDHCYFVFCLGNEKGNKFMTIPNSYQNEKICTYPIEATFYYSMFEESLKGNTDASKNIISVGAVGDVRNLIDLYNPDVNGYYDVLGLTNDGQYNSIEINIRVTPLDNLNIDLDKIKLHFDGGDYDLSKLYIDDVQCGVLSCTKGTQVTIRFCFNDVFDEYSCTSRYKEPTEVECKLKINDHIIMSSYYWYFYVMSSTYLGDYGWVPYDFERN